MIRPRQHPPTPRSPRITSNTADAIPHTLLWTLPLALLLLTLTFLFPTRLTIPSPPTPRGPSKSS